MTHINELVERYAYNVHPDNDPNNTSDKTMAKMYDTLRKTDYTFLPARGTVIDVMGRKYEVIGLQKSNKLQSIVKVKEVKSGKMFTFPLKDLKKHLTK